MNNKMQELLNWLIEQRTLTIENLNRNKQTWEKAWEEGFTADEAKILLEQKESLTLQDNLLAQIIDKVNELSEVEDEDGFDCDIWDEDEPDIKNLFEEEE